LIPRIPHQFLAGPLADRLNGWVPQVCLAFGWFLDRVVIRPEFLQWTIQVTPTVSPGNLVRIMRLRTTDYIFAEFPLLKKGNPVEDFWAPGYLVSSGSQPPSSNLLRDFIHETRLRQGFTSS
jgi:REP element-mobilizing transposase RayT